MKKIAGMVVGADHIIKNNNTFVRLWIRSDKKQAVCKVFEPYFFIEPVSVHAKKLAETISKMRVSHEKNSIILQASASKVSVESLETNSLKKEVIKVSFKTPVALTAFKVFLESEPEMRLFNCAISPARQFMLDNNINFFESFEFEVAGKFNLAGEKYPMNYFLNAGPSDKKFNEITASIYVNSDSNPCSPCTPCPDKKKEKFINWVSVSCGTGEKKQFYNIFNDPEREMRMIEEVKLFLDKISPDFITTFGKENGIPRLVKRARELGGKNSFKLIDFGCDSTPVTHEDSVLAGRTMIDIEQTEKISFCATSKLSDKRFDKTGKSGFSAGPPESIESVARLKLAKELKPIQRPAPQKEEIQKRSDCLLELGRMQVPAFIFISKKTCEIPHAMHGNFSKRTSKSYLEKIFINAKQPIYLHENETGEKTGRDFRQSKYLLPDTTDCAPKGVYSDVEELSLNNALPLIALLKNTCPTTMNCNCCNPVFSTDIQRTNCAPSSKVTVVFKKDHFFFTSFDKSWAVKCHESDKSDAKNRRAREQLKKKFFLRTIPTGPFKKMEKADVLLGDAMELVKNGDADFLEFKKNHTTWFCKNENGILPKAILNLNDKNNKREKGLSAGIAQKPVGITTYCLPQPENHQISDWLKTNALKNTFLLGKEFSRAINSFFTFFADKLKKECNTTGLTFYHIEGSSIFVDAKSSKALKHFCSEKLGSGTLKKTVHWNRILLNGPLGVMAGITKEGLFESIQKEDIPVHANQKEVTKCFLCAGNKKRNEETLTVAKKYITKNNSTAEPQLTFFEGFELPVLTARTRASNTAKQLEINATTTSRQQI